MKAGARGGRAGHRGEDHPPPPFLMAQATPAPKNARAQKSSMPPLSIDCPFARITFLFFRITFGVKIVLRNTFCALLVLRLIWMFPS